jgi:hypothetical protein
VRSLHSPHQASRTINIDVAAIYRSGRGTKVSPGTPDALTRSSHAGALHNLAAVPVFLGLPAAVMRADACGAATAPTASPCRRPARSRTGVPGPSRHYVPS